LCERLPEFRESLIKSVQRFQNYLLQRIQYRKIIQDWQEIDREIKEKEKSHLQVWIASKLIKEGSVICTQCHKVYHPEFTLTQRKCHVKGCSWQCGCMVHACNQCHTSLCSKHLPLHRNACSASLHMKCGWKEGDEILHPELCGNIISSSADKWSHPVGKCAKCSRQCCLKCSVRCIGRESRVSVWNGRAGTNEEQSYLFKSPTCQTIWCKVCKSGNWRQSLSKHCCKRCEVVDSDAFYESESKDSDYTDSFAEDLSSSSSLVDEDADQGETFDGNILFYMQTHNLPKKMGKSNFDHLFRQGKSDEEFSL